MKNKSIILILICSIFIFGCNNKSKNDLKNNDNNSNNDYVQPIVNKNENVIKKQSVDTIDIETKSVTVINNTTQIIASVTNNTNDIYYLNGYNIIVKDENDNLIVTIPSYVGASINVGETKTLNSSIDIDLSDAFKIDYEVIK